MRDALETALDDLLCERGPQKTICPSEVARRAYPETWRSHMAQVHALAEDKAKAGHIRLLKNGQPIEPESRRGVYRIAAVK